MAAQNKNIDLLKSEGLAALAGGKAGGEYLSQLGKTDLAKLSSEEWREFCERMFIASCEDLRRQANEAVPF